MEEPRRKNSRQQYSSEKYHERLMAVYVKLFESKEEVQGNGKP